MATIIDVSSACGGKASALAAAGVRTIIRYYSRDTIRASKRLGADEARQLLAAGLRIGIVHEGRFGDKLENFDHASGLADAAYARTYAAASIGQPGGSAIYFAVDFDARPAQIREQIIPYFQGVADALAQATGEPDYNVGVYGSGATCKAVLDAGLARCAWLAQSTGWAGFTAFSKDPRLTLKQGMPVKIAGVDCDPDSSTDSAVIGDFVLAQAAAPAPAAVAQALLGGDGPRQRINARSGLRLRSGPGVEFDYSRVLPCNTLVFPLKRVGGWTGIDLQGDGVMDGFVSSAYLSDDSAPAATPAAPAPAATPSTRADAAFVPELIRQGSTPAGLKAARVTAANSLPGYPTNGCAAHLSALLQHAGIDIPMTWGAGKLAHLLESRDWTRIKVGAQIAGDVGVCFDNDPTPAGADHIYLVISTSGADKMLIADNQRTEDAPHIRFASGQGKTPTEYFLRAL